jgi:heptose I phosphotransferase
MDAGRLLVRETFLETLQTLHLVTFDAWFQLSSGDEVRRIGARATTRMAAGTLGLPCEVYLKRFQPLGWKERLKNWLSLKAVHHGASPEFEAAIRFQELAIPSVEPLVFGESGGRSLLVTRGLAGYRDLKELLASRHPSLSRSDVRMQVARTLGDFARTMHAAGLHHQDFYLNHVLARVEDDFESTGPEDLRIIDLGRVRERHPLAFRWILKDLAQLHYSAALASPREKMRFLRTYLGRRLQHADRRWIRRLLAKSNWIDQHTQRHGL